MLDFLYRLFIELPKVFIKSVFQGKFHTISFYIRRNRFFHRFSNLSAKEIASRVQGNAESIDSSWNLYSGALRPEVCSGFYEVVKRISLVQSSLDYLEIGSAKGISMAFMGLSAKDNGLSFEGTSFDPYLEEGYLEGAEHPVHYLESDKNYLAPISSSDLDSAKFLWKSFDLSVKQYRDTSTKNFTDLLISNNKHEYDLIYIDGLHAGLTPLTDIAFSTLFIKDGGYIILDDWHWECVYPVKKLFDELQEKIYESWKISIYKIINR